MRCSESDNCQITESECKEICRAYHSAGFIAGMATAAFVCAMVAVLVCLTT